ncbi:MAG: hypothetical protein HY321_15520 [Armatimonadetes bacterium]|nr:hypothetical protein [Armatimonadota bacterium]
MSVKERLHHLIEELPDTDLLVAERMLRGLMVPPPAPEVAVTRHRPSPEEQRASTARLRAAMKGRVSTEAYLREKHEEIDREEARQRERREGMAT